MLTLITLCSYLFYANKDNIYQFLGIKDNSNAEGNETTKEKKEEEGLSIELQEERLTKKPVFYRSYSEMKFVRNKTILRTYSDVDFSVKRSETLN